MNPWIYDEHKHCGVDYSDEKEAQEYDQQHQKFRNYQQEFDLLYSQLGLKDSHEMTLIDFGCGTGALSIAASRHFKQVIAVDISKEMLHRARVKADKEGISNISFVEAGFLSYVHSGSPVDIVVSKVALHHLPDFWKQIAINNIHSLLKPGGLFYLFDVIFNFDPCHYEQKIDQWISDFAKNTSEKFGNEVTTHIRDEYSTFRWVIDGMLVRAGFKIEKIQSNSEFTCEYFCMRM